jgi:beta-alanine degradation protein BauB
MSDKVCEGPLGDIGTRLLFEDDRVRIWEMALEPGEETAPHRHDNDYYLLIYEGDRIAGVPHFDSTGPSAEYIDAEVQPGLVVPMKKGGTELARNIGTKPYKEFIVELKD